MAEKEIVIMTDKGEKKIMMKPVKGRVIKKVWDFLRRIMDDDVKSVTEYLAYVDDIACELTGLTMKELDDLDIDEKEKITNNISGRAVKALNFTMPSLKQENLPTRENIKS